MYWYMWKLGGWLNGMLFSKSHTLTLLHAMLASYYRYFTHIYMDNDDVKKVMLKYVMIFLVFYGNLLLEISDTGKYIQ